MSFFQLIFKQIRQRSLSTILTTLSIALGVALAIAIMVLHRESRSVFGQTDFGYEVLVGVKGSGLQLVTNTVYNMDRSPGNIQFSVYERLKQDPFRRDIRLAIPIASGDSFEGLPIIGTTPQYFGYNDDGTRADESRRFEYRPGRSLDIAQGKVLHVDRFDAVIGSDVSRRTGLKLGDTFQATHGFPQPGQQPDVHDEKWTIVGVLAPTRTAADRALYIGLTSFYTISDHSDAELQRHAARQAGVPFKAPPDEHAGHDHDHEKHFTIAPDGTITLDSHLTEARELSAILVKTRGGFNAMSLIFNLNLQPDVMAVNPATVMRDFFGNFLELPVKVLLLISALVTIVAAISILTTIYNSVSARMTEIAILRALGATRTRIVMMITTEAAVVGLTGGVIGFVMGHGLAGVGSFYLAQQFGEGIAWTKVTDVEVLYILGVVAIAFIAGLFPALKAYQSNVATHLSGG
jgi:putative ABC transport system permease protein